MYGVVPYEATEQKMFPTDLAYMIAPVRGIKKVIK